MENFPNGVRKPKIVGKTTSSKKLGRQDCQVKWILFFASEGCKLLSFYGGFARIN